MKTITYNRTEMESQLIAAPIKILAAISSLCSSIWGKILAVTAFMTTYFFPIKDFIHIVLILVIVDMLFGVAVTVKHKGWSHILSSRLRDSLFKLFIYTVFIAGFFAIESNVIDGYYITSRAAFAIASGVELWSIAANLLILSPNMVFLRIFRKFLAQEMAKKLEMAQDDIEEFLNKENNKKSDLEEKLEGKDGEGVA